MQVERNNKQYERQLGMCSSIYEDKFDATHRQAKPTASSQVATDWINSARGNDEVVALTMQSTENPNDSSLQEDISDVFNMARCLAVILIHLLLWRDGSGVQKSLNKLGR